MWSVSWELTLSNSREKKKKTVKEIAHDSTCCTLDFFHKTHVIYCRPLYRPIPDREFVETYVKAFYLTENEMERWIREHKVMF